MRCQNCGNEVDPASGQCVCGWVVPSSDTAGVPVAVAAPPASPALQPAPQALQPDATRPLSYPTTMSWLITGMLRNRRGVLGALLAAWFNLPLAVFGAGVGLITGGIAGTFGGLSQGNRLSDVAGDIPVLGTMLTSVLLQSGGILGAIAGAILGGLAGFLGALLLPWAIMSERDGTAFGVFLAQLIVAALVGVLYTLYRIATERWWFRIAGAREPSRREAELLLPILADCANRLQLGGFPKLLMDDNRSPNALCGTRHIIVNRGLLDEFDYEPEPIAAVLSHELTHWRNADTVSSLFIRGIVLPLYIVYTAITWVQQKYEDNVVGFLAMVVGWPVLITIRFFLMPMQAAGSRAAEYLADQGALHAGHRIGLRQVLSRFRESFDGSRNGWDNSICATHPPNELRLERAEAPGVNYPLPDPDAPARPLPVVLASGLTRD